MPRFFSVFLTFLANQTQKHKHKLIFSENKNTNPSSATDLSGQPNTKATNRNPDRSKQLKTVSSKCSSRLLLPSSSDIRSQFTLSFSLFLSLWKFLWLLFIAISEIPIYHCRKPWVLR
ncbi:hypothetical protein ACB092_07G132800 [Castanea dentata]